ncbi:alpha/beta-hydrolase [Atractiella rhizophila]|nr:alpha/beta-hydrolase [Atractiella rhizophila]
MSSSPELKPLSAEAHISFPSLASLKLSDDGSKVVYLVSPSYKAHDQEHSSSAIWIADLTSDAPKSRQLTSGKFKDRSPIFHPDGKRVLFLSDRHERGGPAAIYEMHLDGFGGEPVRLVEGKEKEKKEVQKFRVTPDGKNLVFSKPVEPTEEEQKQEKEKDDATDHDAPRRTTLAALFIYNFASKTTRQLPTPPNRNVFDFSISPTSKVVAVFTSPSSLLEHQVTGAELSLISLQTASQTVAHPVPWPKCTSGTVCWLEEGNEEKVWFLRNFVNDDYYSDSPGVFAINLSDAVSLTREAEDKRAAKHIHAGKDSDAASILQVTSEYMAVEIELGLETGIDILDKRGFHHRLYTTKEDSIDLFDLKYVKEQDKWFFVATKGSVVKAEAPEVYFGVSNGLSSHSDLQLSAISNHFSDFQPYLSTITAKKYEWKSRDGEKIEGVTIFPKTHNFDTDGPLPTVLHPHGGPYSRDTWDSNRLRCSRWSVLLATNGYLVLLPNYRGSSGRGSLFARDAHHGMGNNDWNDCITMLEKAIDDGWADKQRLGLGGWSQGGFMTDWGVTQTNIFKACIAGAGVSDWNSMAGLSDTPTFEIDLGGTVPWNPKLNMGSAIEHASKVETPLLLIHGEEDERVPFIQALSFYRAIKLVGKNPNCVKLVSYPREGHGFVERSHALDCSRRVLEFFDTWLK